MVTKTQLANGIRVITESIPHAHSVSIGFWVANGSRHEERRVNGVAHFIEHLLFKGTARRSALDIAREIDSVGGILNAFTGREFVCYYAKVLSKFLPQALDLLADIFLNSAFDPDEIEKERKVILQEISMIEDAPDDYIHDLLAQNIWRGHPLGMPVIGTEESVGNLTREAIVAFRDKQYRGEDIIIAAADTVTASFSEAGDSSTSTEAIWPVSSTTPVRVAGPNPSALTATERRNQIDAPRAN